MTEEDYLIELRRDSTFGILGIIGGWSAFVKRGERETYVFGVSRWGVKREIRRFIRIDREQRADPTILTEADL